MQSHAGVQPRWIQGDSKVGGRSRRLWKNTDLITDIERLEMDSVVGRLVEKRRLNNLARWEFSQRNGEQERSDMGESVFLETDPISLFLGLLIHRLLHIGMNTESRGSQQS